MVYDWFTRSAAPEEGETPQPEEQAEAPAAAEAAPAADPGVDQDALEWARQAYARLKAQQEAEKQGVGAASVQPVQLEPVEPEAQSPSTDSVQPVQRLDAVQAVQVETEATGEELPAPAPQGLSLLEQAAAQRAQRQQELLERATDTPPAQAPVPAAAPTADEAAPQLGAFDDDFTWSAEVLAAQGRQLDQISLEEIDWLGRLRRGMEKTRQGFVTQLLENLGDDPLTPEVLDDLETLLLRADVGVQATDQVLEALRKRLNEEVVEPEEGIRFLKQQLCNLLDTPIQASGAALLAPERGRLTVWLMVGVNGVGKTTTLGKLANLAIRSGYSCLFAGAVTFRAAAVQLVEVWGVRRGGSVVSFASACGEPAGGVWEAGG
ncbi:MAG: signal recognition particle receptor subunit alpha, partial [Vulcanococcus sp.]